MSGLRLQGTKILLFAFDMMMTLSRKEDGVFLRLRVVVQQKIENKFHAFILNKKSLLRK